MRYGAAGERLVNTEPSSSRITQFDRGGRCGVTENATTDARLAWGDWNTLCRSTFGEPLAPSHPHLSIRVSAVRLPQRALFS